MRWWPRKRKKRYGVFIIIYTHTSIQTDGPTDTHTCTHIHMSICNMYSLKFLSSIILKHTLEYFSRFKTINLKRKYPNLKLYDNHIHFLTKNYLVRMERPQSCMLFLVYTVCIRIFYVTTTWREVEISTYQNLNY